MKAGPINGINRASQPFLLVPESTSLADLTVPESPIWISDSFKFDLVTNTPPPLVVPNYAASKGGISEEQLKYSLPSPNKTAIRFWKNKTKNCHADQNRFSALANPSAAILINGRVCLRSCG
jgi:hypothetical protein